MRLAALTSMFVLAMATIAHSQSIPNGSVWKNGGGSELTITSIDSDGNLVGSYTNKVDGFDCQNEPMAVSGRVDGVLLSFTVRWKNNNKDCKSITSWTGYVASGKIYTDWDLIYTAAATGLPAHLKSSDVFSPK